MKCSDLRTNLALYADGLLTEAEGVSIEGHLAVCPVCRQRDADHGEIKRHLNRMARPFMPADLKGGLKRAIVAEIRAGRRSWLPFSPDVREFLQMRVMPYGVGAFASVFVCVTFLTLMFSGLFKTSSLPAEKETPMMAANHNPFVREGDISAADLVQARLGLANESPSINPQGALVALTKTFVNVGMKNDEVVVVADVYSDGLAQIAEVVEPPRDNHVVGELEKALDSGPDNSPFVPASMEARPESVRVVLKFQSVDVHPSKRKSRWQ